MRKKGEGGQREGGREGEGKRSMCEQYENG